MKTTTTTITKPPPKKSISSRLASHKKSCNGCGREVPSDKAVDCEGGCRSRAYCSKECRQRDWDNGHRETCEKTTVATKLRGIKDKIRAKKKGENGVTTDTVDVPDTLGEVKFHTSKGFGVAHPWDYVESEMNGDVAVNCDDWETSSGEGNGSDAGEEVEDSSKSKKEETELAKRTLSQLRRKPVNEEFLPAPSKERHFTQYVSPAANEIWMKREVGETRGVEKDAPVFQDERTSYVNSHNLMCKPLGPDPLGVPLKRRSSDERQASEEVEKSSVIPYAEISSSNPGVVLFPNTMKLLPESSSTTSSKAKKGSTSLPSSTAKVASEKSTPNITPIDSELRLRYAYPSYEATKEAKLPDTTTTTTTSALQTETNVSPAATHESPPTLTALALQIEARVTETLRSSSRGNAFMLNDGARFREYVKHVKSNVKNVKEFAQRFDVATSFFLDDANATIPALEMESRFEAVVKSLGSLSNAEADLMRGRLEAANKKMEALKNENESLAASNAKLLEQQKEMTSQIRVLEKKHEESTKSHERQTEALARLNQVALAKERVEHFTSVKEKEERDAFFRKNMEKDLAEYMKRAKEAEEQLARSVEQRNAVTAELDIMRKAFEIYASQHTQQTGSATSVTTTTKNVEKDESKPSESSSKIVGGKMNGSTTTAAGGGAVSSSSVDVRVPPTTATTKSQVNHAFEDGEEEEEVSGRGRSAIATGLKRKDPEPSASAPLTLKSPSKGSILPISTSKQEKLAEEECVICMERPPDTMLMFCCHSFCGRCLLDCAPTICPACRHPIESFVEVKPGGLEGTVESASDGESGKVIVWTKRGRYDVSQAVSSSSTESVEDSSVMGSATTNGGGIRRGSSTPFSGSGAARGRGYASSTSTRSNFTAASDTNVASNRPPARGRPTVAGEGRGGARSSRSTEATSSGDAVGEDEGWTTVGGGGRSGGDTAYIVDCCRTAGGKKNGALSEIHPADLGAIVVDELVKRTGIKGADVDDVVCGCVSQVGAQGANIGRMIVLASKTLPVEVPGTVVDRQCGSSLQAIHFAAQAVMSGTQDVVIAMGVENMTQVPIGASIVDGLKAGHGRPEASKGIQSNWGEGVQFSQFAGAEMLAKKYKLTREELDKFGYESHIKAAKAQKEGKFKREIVPITVTTKDGKTVVHDKDEGVRPDVSMESMTKLKVLAPPNGLITAATSSQICDGAAAMLIVNERGLKRLGLKPRAKIHTLALAGSDPRIMLEGPIPATKTALKKAGLTIDQIGLYEVNEAFAPVPVSWVKALGADPKKLNVNGGACALGHPLGATGVKITTTLINEMERRKERYGVVAICEGGGTANATIFERIDASSKL